MQIEMARWKHLVGCNLKRKGVKYRRNAVKYYAKIGGICLDRSRTRSAKKRLDKIVGANIRKEREARRITRDELAEVVDITSSHLGLIERGERGATPVTLEKLTQAFNISLDSLFSETSKAFTAREKRGPKTNAYYQKVCTLITQLDEPELKMLTYTIKGILSMRSPASAE